MVGGSLLRNQIEEFCTFSETSLRKFRIIQWSTSVSMKTSTVFLYSVSRDLLGIRFGRASRADADGNRGNPFSETIMKTSFPTSLIAFRSLSRTTRTNGYVYILLIFLGSFTNTQVRWDAVKMRQDVMIYYNDQIVENLIKAKYHLAFVHVDIQNFTSAGASQISGTVG